MPIRMVRDGATIDVPDDAFLVVTIQCGSYLTNGQAVGTIGKGALGLFVDGSLASELPVWHYFSTISEFRPWTFTRALNVSAGSHPIELRGRMLPTSTAGLGFSFDATEPVLQAVMTVVVMRR